SGLGSTNQNTAVELTYGELRTALLNSGQPNFFTATNLPDAPNVNGVSDFWVSSSQAKALGLPPSPNAGVDGSIGIANGIVNGRDITIPAGPDRVAVILHEVGHAMGRITGTRQRFVDGPVYYPELGIFQFRSPGNRTFL